MSKFQIILLSVFGAFILLAVLLFSLARGGSSGSATLTIWGPISSFDWQNWSTNGKLSTGDIRYVYVEKDPTTIDKDFTEALAVGKAPDLIILPESLIWSERNKLFNIPSSSVSTADYKNTFIDEGELLLNATGAYALPLYVDPMVLYWNKDLFVKAALPRPIAYWDEIYAASQKLTEKDSAGNILKSTIALGETKNIPHAKDLLSLLLLQAGTSITASDPNEGLRSTLSLTYDLPISPALAAVDFYTQFSNPSKSFYSWNRSMLPAQTAFISGNSAMYLGFASELREIKAKSPTLNLGLALSPQSRVSGKAITLGRLYSVAISRSALNPSAALSGALSLVSRDSAQALSTTIDLPPARRDLLGSRPQDDSLSVFYDAAIQSRSWIDPNPEKTKLAFLLLIDSVTSGRSRSTEAVTTLDNSIGNIINGN